MWVLALVLRYYYWPTPCRPDWRDPCPTCWRKAVESAAATLAGRSVLDDELY